MAVRSYVEIDVFDDNGDKKEGSSDTLDFRFFTKELKYEIKEFVEISDPEGNATIVDLDDLYMAACKLRRMADE